MGAMEVLIDNARTEFDSEEMFNPNVNPHSVVYLASLVLFGGLGGPSVETEKSLDALNALHLLYTVGLPKPRFGSFWAFLGSSNRGAGV